MGRKDFFNFIEGYEQNNPVETWNYNGVNYWPLIRTSLFFEFSRKYLADSNHVTTKRGSFLSSNIRKLSSIIRSLKFGKAGVLFLGNKAQNIDSSLGSANRWFLFAQNYLQSENLQQRYIETNKVGNGTSLFDIILGRKPGLREVQDLSWSGEFQDLIKSANSILNMTFNRQLIYSYIALTDQLSRKYTKRLSRSNVKFLFVSPYYQVIGYSLMIAARKLNIPTIDVQHGGQGNLHIAYSGFSKIPSDGLALLPKYFWCWDQASTDTINSWADGTYHQALNLGNPWVLANIEKEAHDVIPRLSTKKRILVTLQFNSISDALLKAIQESTADYNWWLRAHPTRVDQRDSIKDILRIHGLSEVVTVDAATDSNLIDLLRSSDLHITRYSGSAIEAEQMGVYSVLIDEVGRDTYSDIIDRGHAFVSIGDGEELLRTVKEVLQLPPFESDVLSQVRTAELFLEGLVSSAD